MLQKGQSKAEVVKFMTERYGDFVLYNPPFKTKTVLLWFGPVLFFLIGVIFVILVIFVSFVPCLCAVFSCRVFVRDGSPVQHGPDQSLTDFSAGYSAR